MAYPAYIEALSPGLARDTAIEAYARSHANVPQATQASTTEQAQDQEFITATDTGLQSARNDVIRRRKEGLSITVRGVAKRNGITVAEAAQIMAEAKSNQDSVEPETTEQETVVSETAVPEFKGYPPELEPLVASGAAFFQDDTWLARRCTKCGQCKTECCGPTELRTLLRLDEKTLTSFGRQAAGLDPVIPPKPPKSSEQVVEERRKSWTEQSWWSQFRGAGELEGSGDVKMYIENFLPEGVTVISGLPKEGKSWLALSIAKALTTGKPLFGRIGFEVPEITPVLYLAAESGDGALKLRCKKFGITEDKTRFISRTLSQGPMFGLDDSSLGSLVKAMRPVVILETLIRFNDGKDEDDASENRKLAEAIFHLIALGARAVIGIHHSRKDLDKNRPTKESAVRGSGDGLAMVDCVWLVMQDERLFQGGSGPNEIDVVGWGRDFNPVPLRLKLTKKAEVPPGTITFAPGIVSCIDSGGDLEWVDRRAAQAERQSQRQDLAQKIEQMVIETPLVTRQELCETTGRSEWEVRSVLKRLGYRRYKVKGGKKNESRWGKRSDAVAA